MTRLPAGFIGFAASEIDWTPNPDVPGIERAIIFGDPTEAGPYALRVRLPPNIRIACHTHAEDRTYTVLDGEWRIGFAERSEEATTVLSFGEGGIYRLPARAPHYQESGPAGAVIQIEATGPSKTTFLGPGTEWAWID